MSNININSKTMNMDLIKKTDYIYHSHSTLQREFSMMQQEFLNFRGEFTIMKRENNDLRIQNQINEINEININHLIERSTKLESTLAHCQNKIYHLEIQNSKQAALITNYQRHYLMSSVNPLANPNLDKCCNTIEDNRVADNREGVAKNDDKLLANIWDNVHKGNRPWNIIIPTTPDSPDNSNDHRNLHLKHRNLHSPDLKNRNPNSADSKNRNPNSHDSKNRNPHTSRNPHSPDSNRFHE